MQSELLQTKQTLLSVLDSLMSKVLYQQTIRFKSRLLQSYILYLDPVYKLSTRYTQVFLGSSRCQLSLKALELYNLSWFQQTQLSLVQALNWTLQSLILRNYHTRVVFKIKFTLALRATLLSRWQTLTETKQSLRRLSQSKNLWWWHLTKFQQIFWSKLVRRLSLMSIFLSKKVLSVQLQLLGL